MAERENINLSALKTAMNVKSRACRFKMQVGELHGRLLLRLNIVLFDHSEQKKIEKDLGLIEEQIHSLSNYAVCTASLNTNQLWLFLLPSPTEARTLLKPHREPVHDGIRSFFSEGTQHFISSISDGELKCISTSVISYRASRQEMHLERMDAVQTWQKSYLLLLQQIRVGQSNSNLKITTIGCHLKKIYILGHDFMTLGSTNGSRTLLFHRSRQKTC